MYVEAAVPRNDEAYWRLRPDQELLNTEMKEKTLLNSTVAFICRIAIKNCCPPPLESVFFVQCTYTGPAPIFTIITNMLISDYPFVYSLLGTTRVLFV